MLTLALWPISSKLWETPIMMFHKSFTCQWPDTNLDTQSNLVYYFILLSRVVIHYCFDDFSWNIRTISVQYPYRIRTYKTSRCVWCTFLVGEFLYSDSIIRLPCRLKGCPLERIRGNRTILNYCIYPFPAAIPNANNLAHVILTEQKIVSYETRYKGHEVNLNSMESVHCANGSAWLPVVKILFRSCFLFAKRVGLMSTTSWIDRVFSHTHRNANCGIFVFTKWKPKSPVTKCYPQWE